MARKCSGTSGVQNSVSSTAKQVSAYRAYWYEKGLFNNLTQPQLKSAKLDNFEYEFVKTSIYGSYEYLFIKLLNWLSPEFNNLVNDYSNGLGNLYFRKTESLKLVTDICLNDNPNNIQNIVILGAGLDCVFHEIENYVQQVNKIDPTKNQLKIDYFNINFYEIDTYHTQQYKKQVMKKSKVKSWNPNIKYLDVDFETEDFLEKMQVNFKRFDPKNQATLYIWEGVTYYLTEPAVFKTYQRIREESSADAPAFVISDMFIRFNEKILKGPKKDIPPEIKILNDTTKYVAFLGEPMNWLIKKDDDGTSDLFLNNSVAGFGQDFASLEYCLLDGPSSDEFNERYVFDCKYPKYARICYVSPVYGK